jgi:hypothetical protein
MLSLSAPLLLLACTGAIDDGSDGGDGGESTPGTGGGAGPAEACAQDVIEPRLWRLTPEQYRNTFADAFGVTDFKVAELPLPVADARTGFHNDAAGNFLSGPLTNTMFSEAERVAAKVGGGLAKSHTCLQSTTVADDCLRAFINDTGRRAFRRPLDESEVGQYQQFFRDAVTDHGARGAAEMVVQALVLSPRFHHRSELGTDGQLAGWEIASALSYGIADSPPSAELLALADEGGLADPAERERIALELAATPRAREKMAHFVYWQLKLPRLDNARQTLGSALVDSMLAESNSFVVAVMESDTPTLERLYTASFSFIDDRLGPIYGVSGKPGALQRTELPPGERFGLFTQAGFLASLHGPVHRGRMLRESVLCQDIPAPPQDGGDLINQLPVTPTEWTQAEKWPVFVQERAGCAGCHSMFEPMGFAFEVYDESGKFRTQNEYGRTIDPASEVAAEGWSGQFSDARDFIDQVVASDVGQTCFAQRYLTFALGRPAPAPKASCTTRNVARRFSESGTDLRELMAATAGDDGFVTRGM